MAVITIISLALVLAGFFSFFGKAFSNVFLYEPNVFQLIFGGEKLLAGKKIPVDGFSNMTSLFILPIVAFIVLLLLLAIAKFTKSNKTFMAVIFGVAAAISVATIVVALCSIAITGAKDNALLFGEKTTYGMGMILIMCFNGGAVLFEVAAMLSLLLKKPSKKRK